MPSTCAADVEAVDRVDVQPIHQRAGRRDSRLFVIHRSDAAVDDRGRRRLAQIVADRAEHHRDLLRMVEILDPAPRLVDRPSACGPRRRLPGATRAPAGQPTSASSSGKRRWSTPSSSASVNPIDGRSAPAAAAFRSHPRSVRRQIVERDLAAQLRGRRIELEPEARGELDGAQHPQAVVAEGPGIDRAQQPAVEVRAPPMRIDVLAGQRVERDGVDGEVAAPRRVLDRHLGIAFDREPAVAASGLRIASRQRDVDVRRPCRP